MFWALVFAGWHIPAAYDFAAAHQPVHDLEHVAWWRRASCVWWVLIDPARTGPLSLGRRLASPARSSRPGPR